MKKKKEENKKIKKKKNKENEACNRIGSFDFFRLNINGGLLCSF